MSFLEFKALRFDNRFWVENGKVVSDNKQGNNALVVATDTSSDNLQCAENILIENNPVLANIFNGTKPFEVNDLDFCITCIGDNMSKIHPQNNYVYTVSLKENGQLSFEMNGKYAYFYHCGISEDRYLLTDGCCARAFERYINRKLNQSIKVDCRGVAIDIVDLLFTGEVYGIIRKDGEYNLLYESTQEKKWKNVSMAEVGIKNFYDIIEQDIKKNSLPVDASITDFWKLYSFLSNSNNVFSLGSKEFEDIKDAKFHALYDKLYMKGKSTLVPGKDSNLIGYYIKCKAKMLFDNDNCGSGYYKVTMQTFLNKEDKEYALENLKETPIRKRNLSSDCFVLKFNNDIENPRVFYEGDTGETIELIKDVSVSMIMFKK